MGPFTLAEQNTKCCSSSRHTCTWIIFWRFEFLSQETDCSTNISKPFLEPTFLFKITEVWQLGDAWQVASLIIQRCFLPNSSHPGSPYEGLCEITSNGLKWPNNLGETRKSTCNWSQASKVQTCTMSSAIWDRRNLLKSRPCIAPCRAPVAKPSSPKCVLLY